MPTNEQEYLKQLEEEKRRKYQKLRKDLIEIKSQLNTLKNNLKSLENNLENLLLVDDKIFESSTFNKIKEMNSKELDNIDNIISSVSSHC